MMNIISLSTVNFTQTPEQFFTLVYDNIYIDFDRLEDGERFKQMLISTDKEALHCLGKFIHHGFRLRDLLQETDFR